MTAYIVPGGLAIVDNDLAFLGRPLFFAVEWEWQACSIALEHVIKLLPCSAAVIRRCHADAACRIGRDALYVKLLKSKHGDFFIPLISQAPYLKMPIELAVFHPADFCPLPSQRFGLQHAPDLWNTVPTSRLWQGQSSRIQAGLMQNTSE